MMISQIKKKKKKKKKKGLKWIIVNSNIMKIYFI